MERPRPLPHAGAGICSKQRASTCQESQEWGGERPCPLPIEEAGLGQGPAWSEHRPGCMLRRGAHLPHVKHQGKEGGNGRGRELGSRGVPAQMGGLPGSPWGRPGRGDRWPWEWRLQEGLPACLWELRRETGPGRTRGPVPGRCRRAAASVGTQARPAGVCVGVGLGPPPKLETQERSTRQGVSGPCRLGWSTAVVSLAGQRWGRSEPWRGPAGLGQSRTPCSGGSRGAGA